MQFTDQLGDTVQLSSAPRRIISLVPSQTELLSDLGLEEEVVGITRFCVRPHRWFLEKTKIGGTKKFQLEKIEELHPDLVIGNKEENYRNGIDWLKEKYPVWMSDITTLDGALQMIQQIGEITRRSHEAAAIVKKTADAFGQLVVRPPRSALYLIWQNPWMAAGRNTFVHSMVERLGLINCIQAPRYPELTDEAIRELSPEIVFLSSEPFPFREKHLARIQSLLPGSTILRVDGEMFSWYGSRLMAAPGYFNSLPL